MQTLPSKCSFKDVKNKFQRKVFELKQSRDVMAKSYFLNYDLEGEEINLALPRPPQRM